jgi:hypothetical protein
MSKILNSVTKGIDYDTLYYIVDGEIKIEICQKSLAKTKKNNGLHGKSNHRKLSLEDEEDIIEAVTAGISPIILADSYNMSVAGIYRMLNRRGVSPRTTRGRKTKKATIEGALFNDYFLAGETPKWKKLLNQFDILI